MSSSKIDPGQQQSFIYTGNFIPNQINVNNLGSAATQFTLTSDPTGWVYYGRVGDRLNEVAGAGQIALFVKFPTNKLTVQNNGPSAIEVTGEGLRPA